MPRLLLIASRIWLLAGLFCVSSPTVAAEREPPAGSHKPLEPVRRSQRGDYDIAHFKVTTGDQIEFPSGYVYEIVDVEERQIVFRAAPKQGIGDDPFKFPAGRCPIGNHHRIVLSNLKKEKQTADISIETKKRWHWWDGFNF